MYENDGFHPYEDNNDAQNRYEAQSSETSGNQWQQPLYQMPQQPEHTQPKKKHTAGRVVALALCCSLLGGAVGAGAMAIGTSMTGTSGGSRSSSTSTILQGDRPTSAINVSKIDTSKEMTAAEVYAANVNSTVGITTSITTNYWGYQTTAAASGSGFILTADGYILTNYHVIENSNSVKVTMYDGTSYDATIVGYDESNDIAVLKIDATGLTPVVLGDSDKLNVGDPVVAIGNPLGELTFSLTSGAVSALNREVTLSSNVTMDLIQTDCAINSGNSGGALFNLYGEVIGITNAKYSSSGSSSEASIDNIGFAIPINSVRSIVESIIKNGYIVKPYIGVSVEDVSSEMTSYGLPAGAVVRSVTDGAPAAQAGLQANDIITAVDGTDVKSLGGVDAIQTRLRGESGMSVNVTWLDNEATEHIVDLTHSGYSTTTVDFQMLQGNVGYIKIRQFDASTPSELDYAIRSLSANNALSLVFDLRDNGGGLLDDALSCIDLVAPEGTLAYAEDQNGTRTVLGSSTGDSYVNLPMVCLVNGNTASAAELFASSLRTLNGARLVGTTTMGKGTIQSSPQRLSDGSAVVITVAKLICGDGSCFDGAGLSVDVDRPLTADEQNAYYDYTVENDPQIQRAVSTAQQMSGTTTVSGVNEAASSEAASDSTAADSAAAEAASSEAAASSETAAESAASSEETASSTAE